MTVYLTDLEYFYFQAGSRVIAFTEKPRVEAAAGIPFKQITLMQNELVERLFDDRLIIKKAC
ncbi:hypothetical protein MOF23_07610 [Bacillus inaquosorum]|uniref:hypothetical protein n=1 Tax=Bacillus inaquosorum TaxID=483913 RepID=UPI00227E510A|nr:hypothetical protein [Bacillus inaquosorum]MCY9308835.1 hypothetical protein [Bacillus inaquosorum]